jgi:hypothetical protein
VTVKKAVLWDVAATACSRLLLACGFFDPEFGGDTFLRNVGSHKIYTAPHPRRGHSSRKQMLVIAAKIASKKKEDRVEIRYFSYNVILCYVFKAYIDAYISSFPLMLIRTVSSEPLILIVYSFAIGR